MSGPYASLLKAYARRTWGDVPDTAYVVWHHRKVMNAVLGFERKVARWDTLDPHLASFAQIASAAVIGCSWCMDFGYFMAHDEVLEYAEAMSATPCAVDDELSHRLQEALGVKAVVELTQLIALENMRSRFN